MMSLCIIVQKYKVFIGSHLVPKSGMVFAAAFSYFIVNRHVWMQKLSTERREQVLMLEFLVNTKTYTRMVDRQE